MYDTLRSLRNEEPKDPPLISRFKDSLIKSKILYVNPYDRSKELALNKAFKKLESNNIERLIEGKAKEFYRNKRLSNR